MIKNCCSEHIYIFNPVINGSSTDCSNFMIPPAFGIFISICSMNYLMMAALHDLTQEGVCVIYKRHIETNIHKKRTYLRCVVVI